MVLRSGTIERRPTLLAGQEYSRKAADGLRAKKQSDLLDKYPNRVGIDF